MSVHRNRTKTKDSQTGRIYKLKCLNCWYPNYWDDGLTEYPRYKRGFKNPIKRIYHFQVRMYKTWKYNRKTQ